MEASLAGWAPAANGFRHSGVKMQAYVRVTGEALAQLMFMKDARSIKTMRGTLVDGFFLVVDGSAEDARQAIGWYVGGRDVLRVEELSEAEWSRLAPLAGLSIVHTWYG